MNKYQKIMNSKIKNSIGRYYGWEFKTAKQCLRFLPLKEKLEEIEYFQKLKPLF